ncbi:HD family phosphohydrolase [Parabacteroides sp. Marseille-P3160]|uniref:HD family phosphohydrolase n=1 Tax=Parabacteroides sp. Marseille-P3160 TaxID=1917887 RepID=UPI0009BB28BA|nr:HDIG domain-containing metalloprotein [Parabacteroides sp. Marseille-P3160]
MKFKKLNIRVETLIYFIITAFLIGWFFPRDGKFRYVFYEGKPWRYGLLTAPSDFPIYKTEGEIKTEKDSVTRFFEPYYRINPEIKTNAIKKLRENYKANLSQKVPPAYLQYIERRLAEVYEKGILLAIDQDKLLREQHTRINLLEENISQPKEIQGFYTVKTAYEFIIDKIPSYLDKTILQSCDINLYLKENISYDKEMSEKVLADKIQNIPQSTGMVQAGERIVDRGEIIDMHTYNILRSLKIVYESKAGGSQRQGIVLLGQFILVFGIMFCFWQYLSSFNPRILTNRRNSIFVLLCILVSCILTEIAVRFELSNIYILPYAIVPIVTRTFFSSHTALFTHLTTVLLCSLMAPFPHEFLLMQTIIGLIVLVNLKDLSQRSQLISCAFFIFLAYVITYLSITLYQGGDYNKIRWIMLLYFGINFILLMFSYILIYMMEKTFGYVSPITLVELSNINNPILKRLSETCPGTFQHSLQVSILASEAASRIGADTQLIRTGALYHDIGKMVNPVFFTENQKGVNPHNQLSFEESAQIIISHVPEGVKMAEKAQLPQAVIDFIRTHHGCGKTKYFYNSFKNKYPDKEIDEELFTYPGPNPFTKETAILMMADSVEAASRSLKEYTDESIMELINRIIDSQIEDGLLKDAPVTFRDVETIKKVFMEKLKTMYHTRISYPELKK